MLILVKLFFEIFVSDMPPKQLIDYEETYISYNDDALDDDVIDIEMVKTDINEKIITELKGMFPERQRTIKRLGNTNFYTITTLEDELDVNYIEWRHRYGPRIEGYENEVTVLDGRRYLQAKILFENQYNRFHWTRFFETSRLLDVRERREIRHVGENLSGLSGLDETATLQNMMLHDTSYPGATFSRSNLNGTIFTYSCLVVADFTETTMEGVDFTGSDLRWADFLGASLTNVNFNNADLRYADFGGANLFNCTMTGAKLYGANFDDAQYENELRINANSEPQLDDIDNIEPVPDRPHGRPQGALFQVHNAFFKMNMDNYMEILNKIINDVNIASYNRDIFEYIKQELSNKINKIFPEEVSKIKKEGLDRVFTHLKEGIDIRGNNMYYNSKLIINNVVLGKSIDYVLSKSDNFIKLYIKSLLNDCLNAYGDGGDRGMSCAPGIIERFILLIGDTLFEICQETENQEGDTTPLEKKCTPNDIKLMNVFKTQIKDLNELMQEYSNLKIPSWKDMPPIKRKDDFKEFIRRRIHEETTFAPSEKFLTDLLIKYDLAFEDNEGVAFGGKRRLKRKNTKRNKNKKRITKRNKNKKRVTKKKITKKKITKNKKNIF